jgi:hypothetical protein
MDCRGPVLIGGATGKLSLLANQDDTCLLGFYRGVVAGSD